jgi:hypothetical protein
MEVSFRRQYYTDYFERLRIFTVGQATFKYSKQSVPPAQ